ncbi:MAG: DUF819 family protein, partial [Planctomycetota bacterium]
MTAPLLILALLSLNIAVCELLARHTALRHLGTSLLVIILTAITANLGLIPTYSSEVEVYNGIFDVLAPMGIFWLLLQVNLRQVLKAGVAMLGLFFIGALGTTVGVVIGMYAVGGQEAFGEKSAALGGMFVGTYIGGSINFNAIALAEDMRSAPLLFAGANAVDALMTAVWMAATIALPRLLRPVWRDSAGIDRSRTGAAELGKHLDREEVDPLRLALLIAMAAASLWLAEYLGPLLNLPSILVLTCIALLLAQTPFARQLSGSRLLGIYAVYMFLAVIGAHCDLAAMSEIGGLALTLFIFVSIVIGL